MDLAPGVAGAMHTHTICGLMPHASPSADLQMTLKNKGIVVPGMANVSIRRGISTALWHAGLNVLVFLLALPLCIIPVAGPFLFAGCMAVPLAWELQALYFDATKTKVGDQWKYAGVQAHGGRGRGRRVNDGGPPGTH